MKRTLTLALSLTTLTIGACAELDPATATSAADLVPAKSVCAACTVTGLEVDAAAFPAGTFLDFVPTSTTGGSAHVLLARQGDPHATANQSGDGDGTVIWDIKEVGVGGGLAAYDALGRLRCTFASGQLRAATGTLIYTVVSGAVIPARTTAARYRQIGDDLVDARGTRVAAGAPGQGALAPVMLAELAAVLDGACGATP